MNLEKEQVNRLLDTLKEYTDKLEAIMNDVQNPELTVKKGITKGSANYSLWVNAQKQYVIKMRPAILDLTRVASQLSQHAGLSDIDRATLRIRLHDLEATGDKVQHYLMQHQ